MAGVTFSDSYANGSPGAVRITRKLIVITMKTTISD
jgi:hypothetical protein